MNVQKKPLISILIPCYNCEKWLAETLESALSQTWENIEVIVVDDGSTDKSLAIARAFESQNVKVFHQQNRGASAARNKALKECQGDFIQYLDADDLLESSKIERQIQLLEDSDSKFVASGEWARFYKAPSEALFTPQPLWKNMSPVDWLVCAWEEPRMMHPAAWLIPRSIIEKAGDWDTNISLNDDGEYFCRVVLASQGVKFCWGAKTYYRSGNSSSLSGSKSWKARESLFLSLDKIASHLLAAENSSRTRQACATAFQRFIYVVYPNAPDLQNKAEAKVRQFGGSNLKPCLGTKSQLLSSLVGWRLTKRIQKLVYR